MSFECQLVITHECNLRCGYCYMHKNSSKMSKEVFNRVLYYTLPECMKILGHKNYNVVFFGGEPLLNWPLIEYALPKLMADSNCNRAVIITNGLEITEEMMAFIKQYNMRANFAFSYDGLWQDQNRPTIDKSPTTTRYAYLLKHVFPQFSGGFKTMVAPQDVSTLVENFDFCVSNGIKFIDFTLVRDAIWSESDVQLFDVNFTKLTDRYIELFLSGEEIINSLIVLYLSFILNFPAIGKPSTGCYAGFGGASFMPNGDAYPCARFGTNDILKLYDYKTNTFIEDNFFKLTNRLVNVNTFQDCKECIVYDICKAGCLYSQLHTDELGYYGKPVESVCRLYKIIYRECFRFVEATKHDPRFKSWLMPTLLLINN